MSGMKRTEGPNSVIKKIFSPLLLLFHSTMAIPKLFPQLWSSQLQVLRTKGGTVSAGGVAPALLLDEELQKGE